MKKSRSVPLLAAAAMSLALMALPALAAAADRYVATTGTDTSNNCLNSGSPCKTLQHAIDEAVMADTIHVAAGTDTVAGLVTVNKTLTLLGAKAGVDARTRPTTGESILSNSQGMSVRASDGAIDRVTVPDSV